MTDAPTCEVCGKKDWRLADGVCRDCTPVVADLRDRRQRGLLAKINDAAPPGDRIAVTPRSSAGDTCAVCGNPFTEPVHGHYCEGGTVIFLHDLCERRYLSVF